MNPYEAMNHPWLLSKQQRNEQQRESQNVQHFTVKESNTSDILNKFNLVNRTAVRFMKTKNSNDEF